MQLAEFEILMRRSSGSINTYRIKLFWKLEIKKFDVEVAAEPTKVI